MSSKASTLMADLRSAFGNHDPAELRVVPESVMARLWRATRIGWFRRQYSVLNYRRVLAGIHGCESGAW